MKIEVGNTYKSERGHDWKILYRGQFGSFLGTCLDEDGSEWFSEGGEAVGEPFLEDDQLYYTKLLPNIVRKEMWTIICLNKDGVPYVSTSLMSSKQEAREKLGTGLYPSFVGIARVEWEE